MMQTNNISKDTQITNTKTGYTDNFQFWVDMLASELDKFDPRTPEQLFQAKLWLGEFKIAN